MGQVDASDRNSIVAGDAIPDDVRAFITEHVRSLIALELLLGLHADPSRAWSAEELAKELRASTEWAQRELQNLVRRGLAAQSDEAGSLFQYAPQTQELANTVARLASLYPDRRYSIIQILSATLQDVQNFADAFKFKKKE